MVKRLSVIVVILAAAVLLYGFIDAGSYRAGYAAGSVTVSRMVERACADGFVLDNGLCDVVEDVLYPPVFNEVGGLAQVSTALGTDAPVAASKAKRSRRLRKASVKPADVATTDDGGSISPVAESAPQAPQRVPVIAPATQKVLDRIAAAQALPADFCSKNTVNDCIENGNFMCGKATGTCAFTPLVTGFRSIPAGQTASYMDCLTPEIIDRIGVSKRVGNWCVAVDGSSQMVALNNPSEVRMTGEQARDPLFRQALAESGVAASTAAMPVATTVSLPLCSVYMSQNYVPGQMMDMSKCIPDPMPSCPSNRWNNGACVSSAYVPLSLAQLIDALVGFFR